jgi:hypothetical protein
MLREGADVGVNKEICVDEDHLKASLSAMVSTSAMLSALPMRQCPRATAVVRNG